MGDEHLSLYHQGMEIPVVRLPAVPMQTVIVSIGFSVDYDLRLAGCVL